MLDLDYCAVPPAFFRVLLQPNGWLKDDVSNNHFLLMVFEFQEYVSTVGVPSNPSFAMNILLQNMDFGLFLLRKRQSMYEADVGMQWTTTNAYFSVNNQGAFAQFFLFYY